MMSFKFTLTAAFATLLAAPVVSSATGIVTADHQLIDRVQGEFASAADQLQFQATLAKALGHTVKIKHPRDDPAAGDGTRGDQLGYAVALSGDLAIAGAPWDSTIGGNASGSAYVFVRSGGIWTRQAKLIPGDAGEADQFGCSVALAGDTALIGACGDSNAGGASAGSAYVFTRTGNNWSQQVKLIPADGTAGAQFGWSVALTGDLAVVGAPQAVNAAGTVYAFVRTGSQWSQQTRLAAPASVAGDGFGHSVSLASDSLLVGAPGRDTSAGVDSGAAFVFTRSGMVWGLQAALTANTAGPDDFFGSSVAISGDTVLVGASLNDNRGHSDAGAATVFVRSGTSWSQQTTLLPALVAESQQFGYSVALRDDQAVVATFLEPRAGGGWNPGAVHVFDRSGVLWSEQVTVSGSLAGFSEWFGRSIALSAGEILVGASGDNGAFDLDGGAVYVYSGVGPALAEAARLTVEVGASHDTFGSAVAIAGDLALVGAEREDSAGSEDSGAAYVFLRQASGWTLQSRLQSEKPRRSDQFGHVVSLHGTTAAIGTDAFGDGFVEVFVLTNGSWTRQARLSRPVGAGSDAFGEAIALDGDILLVGDSGADTPGAQFSGAAYVFSRIGAQWNLQAQLVAPDAALAEQFGAAVALRGDTALVGAPRDADEPTPETGSVHVFTRAGTQWSAQAKLVALLPAYGAQFGASLALDGNTALIGAPEEEVAPGARAGAAYLFTRIGSTWSQEARLAAVDGAAGDYFGGSVALSGDIALVGAGLDDTATGANAGSASLFARNGALWSFSEQRMAPDARADDNYAWSVALDHDTALLGAFGDTSAVTGNFLVGSVYVEINSLFDDGFE